MLFTFLSSAVALLSLASSIPSTRAAELTVVVGGPGILKYSPQFVTAAVGDTVVFSFRQKNHTATQSSLTSPCVHTAGGFDSGFVPVPDTNTAGPFPSAVFKVTDTKPIWVFCQQGSHCQAGMVFAINPGPGQFATFQATAMGAAPAPPTPSAGAGGTDHKVIVGGPGTLAYSPNEVQAQPGDTITFEFHQKNHTATQSTFANPCSPLSSTSTTGAVGFDSGFMAVADTATTFPTWTVRVNDTNPIWVYCRQANHCGAGMVMAVNSVDSGPNSFTNFKNKAMGSNGTASTSSGTPAPTSAASSLSTVGRGWGVVLAMLGVVAGMAL